MRAIWSRWPILQNITTSDPSEAVCVEVAHPDGPLLVYGSIIAYAGYKGPDGTSRLWEDHYRYIEWHEHDWKQLRAEFPRHHLITGGDYNQNRDGARWYGTRKGRVQLTTALLIQRPWRGSSMPSFKQCFRSATSDTPMFLAALNHVSSSSCAATPCISTSPERATG